MHISEISVIENLNCCVGVLPLTLQVIASVLRNLSWRADVNSKKTLREVGSVRALMGCALEVQKVSSSVHQGAAHDCSQNSECD